MKNINLSQSAIALLQERYLLRDKNNNVIESIEDFFYRIVSNIALADTLYKKQKDQYTVTLETFYKMLTNLDFLPNSPTLMFANTPIQQLAACFALPISDSIDSIFETIKNAAKITKCGGGVGYNFSFLRAKNSIVNGMNGISSGPVSFLKVFDTAISVMKQGGKRRGAQMGALSVHHPDIEEFIKCKHVDKTLSTFNISVIITDQFMQALENNEDYELINPSDQKTIKCSAKKIWDLIVQSAWKNGEPGLLFIDEIQNCDPMKKVINNKVYSNLYTSNPCGEIILEVDHETGGGEACNLGSINLTKHIKNNDYDWDKLRTTIKNAVHFLDNVIDMSKYPLKIIEEKVKKTRKIGLGVMGLADSFYMLNIKYDSDQALKTIDKLFSFIKEESKKASIELAEIRGPYPLYQESFEKLYIRNATRTAIAPTGSISMIADCSSGIEPLFGLVFVKRVLDGKEILYVNPYFEKAIKKYNLYSQDLINEIYANGSIQNIPSLPQELKDIFVTAGDISGEWHVKIQAAIQKYIDNSVSKTINLPETATIEDVSHIYKLAYKLKCKGVTVYRNNSREEQVLNKNICPQCGKIMKKIEKCVSCISCGYSYCTSS